MSIPPPEGGALSPAAAWSQRVRKVGGYIQLAFAAFWLIRGALTVGGATGTALAVAALVLVLAVLAYAIRFTAGTGRRPTSPQAKAIDRSVTAATVIELAAGALLLGTAAAGFRDLAGLRPGRSPKPKPARLSPQPS